MDARSAKCGVSEQRHVQQRREQQTPGGGGTDAGAETCCKSRAARVVRHAVAQHVGCALLVGTHARGRGR